MDEKYINWKVIHYSVYFLQISDLQDTIESQKKMIERLRENRRADPALQGGENNAVAR